MKQVEKLPPNATVSKAPPRLRSESIDLLRIFSMLAIVTLHIMGHGGVLKKLEPFSWQYYFCWTLEGVCYIAVNCYVLISGYFQSTSRFKLKKLLILCWQTLFYAVTIYAVLTAAGLITFSWENARLMLIPLLSKRYWYVTVYAALYALSPFLNGAVRAMPKRTHFSLLLVLLLLFSGLPTFLDKITNGLNFGGGYGIVWFVALYLLAAYLRRYYTPDFRTGRHLLRFAVFALLVPLSKFCVMWLSKTPLLQDVKLSDTFFKYNSILVLLSSLFAFLLFLNLKINNRILAKGIAVIAPLTFGVYLIHEHPSLRGILWKFIDAPAWAGSRRLIVFLPAAILGIFLACIIIEQLRTFLFKPLLASRRLDGFCGRAEERICRAVDRWAREEVS